MPNKEQYILDLGGCVYQLMYHLNDENYTKELCRLRFCVVESDLFISVIQKGNFFCVSISTHLKFAPSFAAEVIQAKWLS